MIAILSRKSTLVIAEIYDFVYTIRHRTATGYNSIFKIKVDELYDLLFKHEFDFKFLDRIKKLKGKHPRKLKEFIINLHNESDFNILLKLSEVILLEHSNTRDTELKNLIEDLKRSLYNDRFSITEDKKIFIKDKDIKKGGMAQVDKNELKIFISHSSKDESLAKAIIELLRSALNISSEYIRCTSVPGYKLNIGENSIETIRYEVKNADVLIALVTENSLSSIFVLFELGARWGANKYLAPLLGPGLSPSELSPPLDSINALSCDKFEDLQQFVENISLELDIPLDKASSYTDKIKKIYGSDDEPYIGGWSNNRN